MIPEPIPFGRQAVTKHPDGTYSLSISIGTHNFSLPALHIGNPDSPVTIFKLNLQPQSYPELAAKAAKWYAEQLLRDHIRILLIPPSTKSTHCLLQAAQIAQESINHSTDPYQLRIIQLHRGHPADKDMLGCAYSVTYRPITAAPNEHRRIGLTNADTTYLQSVFATSEQAIKKAEQHYLSQHIAVADDVLSTGATIQAVQQILQSATQKPITPHIYVLARESPEPFTPLPTHIHAAMYIPVIHGHLS